MKKRKADNTCMDEAMLYRIAKDYYVFGMKEETIACRENISRPHVSRLLSIAKKHGMVRVDVVMPNHEEIDRIEPELRQISHLKYLKVVYVPEEFKSDQRKTSLDIASEASEIISEYLVGCRNTGIGWGFTMYETAKQLSYADSKWGGSFTPLIGVSSESSPYLQVNTITDHFSEKSFGTANYTNIPIALDNQQQMSKMEKSKLKEIETRWSKLDSAIVGLGTPYKKDATFMISEAGSMYKEVLSKDHAVGDILATFFRENGEIIHMPPAYKIVAIDLNKLMMIPKVLCLAGGNEKVMGIYTAIRMNYINGLVTDSNTAQKLLELFNKNSTQKERGVK